MAGLDLSTPESTRAFLRICIGGRVKRTPAKLAQIIGMREWLRTPLHQHAPHLGPLHAEAERLRREAERAQRAYVAALTAWIDTDPTWPPLWPGSPRPRPHPERTRMSDPLSPERFAELRAEFGPGHWPGEIHRLTAEVDRLHAAIAEAVRLIEAGPQLVGAGFRVEEHWSVVAHRAAKILRAVAPAAATPEAGL